MTNKLTITSIICSFVLAVMLPSKARAYDEADLDKLKSTNACMKCDLSKANLEGAKLQGAKLQGANLEAANLQGANLNGADLFGANLFRANLEEANLSATNLEKGALQRPNLNNAILSKANLQSASLERAQFQGANLEGANLSESFAHDANFQGANLQGANLQKARLYGANLEEANLAGAKIEGAMVKVGIELAEVMAREALVAADQKRKATASPMQEAPSRSADPTASSPDLANTAFIASKKWFKLEGDEKKDVFRGYAGLVSTSSYEELIDFPNLFVLNCQPDNVPYLTIHFPERYKFQGFKLDTWLPKTEVYVRTEAGTFRFDAELNSNEFHIDLDEVGFRNMRAIWNSKGPIDLKFSATADNLRLVFGDERINASTRNIIGEKRKITNEYWLESVIPRCLSKRMESENGRYWILWGSVWCPDCTEGKGETFAFVNLGKEGGKGINSQGECLKLKNVFEENLRRAGTMSELMCLKVSELD